MVSQIKPVFPESARGSFDFSQKNGKKARKINLKQGSQNQPYFPNSGNVFPC
jgi:hypothetical protein